MVILLHSVLIFSQLLLVALEWLGLMLQGWPEERLPRGYTRPIPTAQTLQRPHTSQAHAPRMRLRSHLHRPKVLLLMLRSSDRFSPS
jgi:hypothetical protein